MVVVQQIKNSHGSLNLGSFALAKKAWPRARTTSRRSYYKARIQQVLLVNAVRVSTLLHCRSADLPALEWYVASYELEAQVLLSGLHGAISTTQMFCCAFVPLKNAALLGLEPG
jgi:hypothetical protein